MNEMEIKSRKLYNELRDNYGGTRDHYMALAYLDREFGVGKNAALNRIDFNSSGYGINAFHFDEVRKNLYLLLVSVSSVADMVKQPLYQFAKSGLDQIFATEKETGSGSRFFNSLVSCIQENSAIIDQVFLRVIMAGGLDELEKSEYVKNLLEQIEDKKYLIDRFFNGRTVRFSYDQRSISGSDIRMGTTSRVYEYSLDIGQILSQSGSGGEKMAIFFMRLTDLLAMYREMGSKFFERNIRYGLGDNYVNRSIAASFKRIVLEGKEQPGVFAFNHNGVTIAAQEVRTEGNRCHIVSPRLLNGAQTVTTFDSFCKGINFSKENPDYEKYSRTIEGIKVLCKTITDAQSQFITTVTINNNRQNPVAPWDLHANDDIQLQLQDKFRSVLGIYYERQKNAFADIDPEEENGIIAKKEIKLLKLAQTFLASDGELRLLGSLRDVFEEDEIYERVFSLSRLKADLRAVVLCYKIQFRLHRLIKEIVERGPTKYWYLKRAKNLLWALLCQAVLNDERIDDLTDSYGTDMVLSNGYINLLAELSSRRCRPLIAFLEEKNRDKIDAGDVTFLNRDAAFTHCMNEARERWGWVKRGLR